MAAPENSCGNAVVPGGSAMKSQYFNRLFQRASTADHAFGVSHQRERAYNQLSRGLFCMRRKTTSNSAQILLFPTGELTPDVELGPSNALAAAARSEAGRPKRNQHYGVVVSGSFRRDTEGLRQIHEELQDLGFGILSPVRVDPAREVNGFVFMTGEEGETPERIELKHLEAIQEAAFVWLHAPDGYVGLSAALEVGFAHAQGIPVFCRTPISDVTLGHFVHQVDSPADVMNLIRGHKLPVPAPNVSAFQRYYKRVASQRGYERETAQNCLLLMVEEIGELARAIRKREKLVRHSTTGGTNEAHELADVFLYVIHMANILGLDLGATVREKEGINLAKFVRSR
jgi:NTP pyrophosphatase (non-canonical NTP hydrolase)